MRCWHSMNKRPQWYFIETSFLFYAICIITRWADTERVPPARGVMVRAAAVPSGFLTVKTELISKVFTINMEIW